VFEAPITTLQDHHGRSWNIERNVVAWCGGDISHQGQSFEAWGQFVVRYAKVLWMFCSGFINCHQLIILSLDG